MKPILLFILPILALSFNTSIDGNKSNTVIEKHMDEKFYSLRKGTKYGFINTKGEWIIEPKFDHAYAFDKNGFAQVELNDRWGHINPKAEWVIKPKFDENWVDAYRAEFNGKQGMMDTKGDWIIAPRYDETAYEFDKNGLIRVKFNGKWGIIEC